jgi:hypothetical protein
LTGAADDGEQSASDPGARTPERTGVSDGKGDRHVSHWTVWWNQDGTLPWRRFRRNLSAQQAETLVSELRSRGLTAIAAVDEPIGDLAEAR